MSADRSELIARLEAVRVALAAAGDRAADAWNVAVEGLAESATGDDQEWLVDQLDNIGHLFGVPGIERAQTFRMLAAEGRASWDDEASPGPLPHFSMRAVRVRPGVEHGAVALAELASGGGHGPWTWGYDETMHLAWFSDARRGASSADVRTGLEAMALELARIGLEFDRG